MLSGRRCIFDLLVPGKMGACFDLLYRSYILQRWIYRVDPTRINEFGQVMVPQETLKEDSKKDK